MNTSEKKLLIALLTIVALAVVLGLAACKNPDPKAITGVTFEDMTVDYDGREHEITVSGQLPHGVSVEYHSNKATTAGEYIATAIITGEGYRTLVLDAKLTVKPLQIVGVTFEDVTVDFDGGEHEITVAGNLPNGVNVKYYYNKACEVGQYTAYAILSGDAYETLTLTAKLTINSVDIVGVTFEDSTVDYDGAEHAITVKGSLPSGVSVHYLNNKATDVGEHTATAVLTGKGYNPLTLTAKLTVKALDIVGVRFSDLTVDYDGAEHALTVNGILPRGVTVNYTDNKATDVGEYSATAKLTGKGYNPLTLTAKLTVKALNIVGITFEDLTVDYDGREHALTVSGIVPKGVSVTYIGNKAAEVGEYTATAKLTGNNYNPLTLTAKLTVKALDITGVSFEDLTVEYDGAEHELTVKGDLPDGVIVSYTDNKAIDVGVYAATAVLSGKGYKTLTLTATLTVEINYIIVSTADELSEAVQQGGRIALEGDITLENGAFVEITKDVVINGMGHTITAVNYGNSNYRVIDLVGGECKDVTISNLNIVAQKAVPYLRGINVRMTEDLYLKLDGVSIDLADYYAFNVTNGNSGLTVQMDGVRFSAWGAICNHGVNVTLDAVNSEFIGTSSHSGPSNGFMVVMVSDYVLYNDDAFIAENLCANNTLTFTDCKITARVTLDSNNEPIKTMQWLIDIRSPYNNRITLNNCVLTRAYDGDKLAYSVYDSAYIPDENRDDPDFVVDTNKVIVDGVDVTKNSEFVENYFDE